MSESLQEFVDSGSQTLRVDRSAGVIRGVKLLGLRSRNGRRYLETALAEAVSLYEGAKVNVNHPKGHPLSPRDYQDRLGVIGGVHLRAGEGIFGDLQFNPKHALAEQLMWDAEHAAHNVGLSHNVLARTSQQGEETVVEAITKVQSIDLVADPATTRGLFEQQESTPAESEAPHAAAIAWDALTLEQVALHRPDLLAELRRTHEVELTEARSRLDEVAARDALIKRRARVVALLQKHELPLPYGRSDADRQIVSDRFLESLVSAADDEALRRLVEERAALVHAASRWGAGRGRAASRPVSRDLLSASAAIAGASRSTAKEFAAAIGGR